MGFTDPYFDADIGDLRNLLGAKSSAELREREPQVVFANELELESASIPRTNDFTELLAIHGQLFHRVYDWAGEVRAVDIKKNAEAAEYFLPVSNISPAATYVFTSFAKERYLQGLSRVMFVARLAYFYDQVNFHPSIP